MDEQIGTKVADNSGVDQYCALIGKSNNQNGATLYTFRNENSSEDFTILRDDDKWTHLNGNLPCEDCVLQLSVFLDHLEKNEK